MPRALLGRDARLPEEPGRLRQARRHAPRRRAWCGRRPGRRRRPRGREHVRLHRGGPAGVDRHRPGARRRRARRAPGSSSPAAWPSATATSWPTRCPRSTPSPASACRSRSRRKPRRRPVPSLDLLNLPRPPATAPWAYVKIAEGCDRTCGFCAIPTFRGPQRSRTPTSSSPRSTQLGAAGDRARRPGPGVATGRDVRAWAQRVDRAARRGGRAAGRPGPAALPLSVRPHRRADRRHLRHRRALLRPVAAARVEAAAAPDAPLGRRRPVPRRIDDIRRREPDAAFRSNFIVGYPGETEADHDQLLAFVDAAQLDWCGFFAFSRGGRHLRRRARRQVAPA